MNDSPLVSIIIPAYKVSKYIESCLNSVINQSLSSWEAIVIDDHSPENEYEIVKKIQQEDTRIKLIRHDFNKGLGESRNTGCKYARGKYLFFLDSDDLLPKDILLNICDLAESKKLDLIITDFYAFYDNDPIDINASYPARAVFSEQFRKVNEIISWKDMASDYDLIMPSIFSTTCWGKLFRKELWDDLNCHVPLGLRMAEDLIPVKKYLFSSHRILAYPMCSILYRQRESSATKKRSMNAYDIIKCYPEARKMLSEALSDDSLNDYIERFFVQVFLEHMFTFLPYREWFNFYKQCAPYISEMNIDKLQDIFKRISIKGWSNGSIFSFCIIICMYLKRKFNK
ncbi:glycosyltransferase family 2 protein [Vibrio mangrovi]|uniref:Glycosyltransferase family 2 protein n=1 Tax=Vibrio mangrovi TaxID=474394 RepID=A0A1Y6IV84_9VIBR|nr:glycosyltransferase family 2 protein [Vibrio mangrovi]MDW6002191.1 glycosyltransferase family 2 protein [Vibrio mangrovi]SMS01536.1 putative glycosyltransferase EpsJ [Vibrio mangrovi]